MSDSDDLGRGANGCLRLLVQLWILFLLVDVLREIGRSPWLAVVPMLLLILLPVVISAFEVGKKYGRKAGAK